MELIFKEPTRVHGFSTFARASGVTALDNKAGNQTMEDGVVVVAIEAQLEEVARCDWCLLCEQL